MCSILFLLNLSSPIVSQFHFFKIPFRLPLNFSISFEIKITSFHSAEKPFTSAFVFPADLWWQWFCQRQWKIVQMATSKCFVPRYWNEEIRDWLAWSYWIETCTLINSIMSLSVQKKKFSPVFLFPENFSYKIKNKYLIVKWIFYWTFIFNCLKTFQEDKFKVTSCASSELSFDDASSYFCSCKLSCTSSRWTEDRLKFE